MSVGRSRASSAAERLGGFGRDTGQRQGRGGQRLAPTGGDRQRRDRGRRMRRWLPVGRRIAPGPVPGGAQPGTRRRSRSPASPHGRVCSSWAAASSSSASPRRPRPMRASACRQTGSTARRGRLRPAGPRSPRAERGRPAPGPCARCGSGTRPAGCAGWCVAPRPSSGSGSTAPRTAAGPAVRASRQSRRAESSSRQAPSRSMARRASSSSPSAVPRNSKSWSKRRRDTRTRSTEFVASTASAPSSRAACSCRPDMWAASAARRRASNPSPFSMAARARRSASS